MTEINILKVKEETPFTHEETESTSYMEGTKKWHNHIFVPKLDRHFIKSFEPELWFHGWYEGKCDICL